MREFGPESLEDEEVGSELVGAERETKLLVEPHHQPLLPPHLAQHRPQPL